MLMSDPDEPCVWLLFDAREHLCIIMRTFDIIAIDPEIESVAIRLHVSIAFAVFGDGAECQAVERGGERTEDDGWVDRHVCPFLWVVDAMFRCLHRGLNPGPTD